MFFFIRGETDESETFTITDVGVLLGIKRLPGGDEDSYNVVCPFCGDERGKCNFNVIKNGSLMNVYHCFHCGAAGNMLTLYADLKESMEKTASGKPTGRYRRNFR